jgi:hypothetical protein
MHSITTASTLSRTWSHLLDDGGGAEAPDARLLTLGTDDAGGGPGGLGHRDKAAFAQHSGHQAGDG